MRWILWLALLPGLAFGLTDTLTGTSDESAGVGLPDGKGGYLISGEFDGATCTLQFQGKNATWYDVAAVTVDDVAAINWDASVSARVACTGAAVSMNLYVEIQCMSRSCRDGP